MKLKDMFKKTMKKGYIPLKETKETDLKPEVPEGLLRKCNICKAAIMTEEVKQGNYICPKCHSYFRMHAFHRIHLVTKEDSFEEWDVGLTTKNPLNYPGYEEKIASMKLKTKLDEAVVTGIGVVGTSKAVLAVCDGRFMMASMGQVVGEKITRAIERATEKSLPIIIFSCSGGARMQEGITSLMQMAKTSAALKRHSDKGQLYISVLTDPTTGGVTASFAMLGDVILAEPGALIGFAGPRVIEQTIGQKLPKGFQRAEFLLEHGFVDRIVERESMKDVLSQIMQLHKKKKRKKEKSKASMVDREKQIAKEEGSVWDRVERSRKNDRPVGTDYIDTLFTDFMEFHGDRYFKDDKAIVGGVGKFRGMPVTIIAQAKGRTTKENISRNFGMPSPDGYRKALRLMKQAEKFQRPVICFVDTPGAFCGLEAEERGQGEAIARNLYEMSGLKVPILSIVIGEGGSGGALAMAVADEVWMLENAIYSILSPEGFASILWKDSKRAKEAANLMKLTAKDLKEGNMIEHIIEEPTHLTVHNLEEVCKKIEQHMNVFFDTHVELGESELLEHRYNRFRQM